MTIFISIDFGLAGAVDTAGTRPYTGTNPLWNNSSIFLDGGISQTQTQVGRPTTIKVRVSAAPRTNFQFVTVDAYVLVPFAGVLSPDKALKHNGIPLHFTGFADQITAGSGNPSPSDPHVVTCQIQDPVQGPVPWTPNEDDLAATTNGHLCVIANAYAEEPTSGAPIPATTPFDVHNDPHQGQRNINVLQDAEIEGFTFMVFGPPEEEFILGVDRLTPKDFGPSERWLLVSLPNVKALRKGGEELVLVGDRHREPVPLTHSRRDLAGRLDLEEFGTHDLRELAAAGPQKGIVARSGEEGFKATVGVERDDKPGSLLGFDVVVRRPSGEDLGGLRLLTLMT